MKTLMYTICSAMVLAMSVNMANAANNSLLYDGVNDYTHMSYKSLYQTPVFTYEAWVCPTYNNTLETTNVIGRGEDFSNDNAAPYLCIRSQSSTWGTGVGVGYETNSDTDYAYSTAYFPPINTWTHLAITRASDGKLSIYANGGLLNSWNSTPTPTNVCLQEFTIGAIWQGQEASLGAFFKGYVDEIRVWNYARTGTEIQSYYNQAINPSSGGLIGYWTFDEGYGTTSIDITGNNNAILGLNGTGSDVPLWMNTGAPIVPEPATMVMLALGGLLLRRRMR